MRSRPSHRVFRRSPQPPGPDDGPIAVVAEVKVDEGDRKQFLELDARTPSGLPAQWSIQRATLRESREPFGVPDGSGLADLARTSGRASAA